jgi:hypothetical protein
MHLVLPTILCHEIQSVERIKRLVEIVGLQQRAQRAGIEQGSDASRIDARHVIFNQVDGSFTQSD